MHNPVADPWSAGVQRYEACWEGVQAIMQVADMLTAHQDQADLQILQWRLLEVAVQISYPSLKCDLFQRGWSGLAIFNHVLLLRDGHFP